VFSDSDDSARRSIDAFFGWLPQLVGALVILIIGYIIAKVLAGAVSRALGAARLDDRLFATSAGSYIRNAVASPSRFIGRVVYWLIFLGALSLAVTTLGVGPLTAFVAAIYAYLPNVIAALLIFLVAASISGVVATLALKFLGDTPTGKLLAAVLPVMTMAIAIFMILNQLQIAKDIVNITYSGLIATMVLALGLSFGLGGRDVASELLREGYDKAKGGVSTAKRDLHQGRERTRDQAS
jgi:hypothetical protein